MAPIELFNSLLQSATAQGSRANALNPLAWAFGLALSALLVATRIPQTPAWLLEFLGCVVALVGIAFLTAYFILLFVDRDALRSERFTLSKMALEKSILGDSTHGPISLGGFTNPLAISTGSEPTQQEAGGGTR
jgi:hypothetical protein